MPCAPVWSRCSSAPSRMTVTVCIPRCGCSSKPFGARNQSSLRKRNGVVLSHPSAPTTICLFSTCELAPCGITRPTRLMRLSIRSNPLELGVLHRAGEAVEHLVHLVPGLEPLHALVPALQVRIRREVGADELGQADERGGEIVGDGDLVAGEILLLADQALVEDLHPGLGALLRPGELAFLVLVGRPLVERKDLRIDQAVGEVAAELGVDPVHALVYARALLEVLRIRG